ncbi:MAG: Dabb family protein [Eubacteriales bacterium]
MVYHVILWDLKDEIAQDERDIVKGLIKEKLEALNGQIEGLLDLKIFTNPLPSSNSDLMLVSTMKDAAALEHYQSHPKHVEAAGYVRSVVTNRRLMDCEY